MDSLIDILKSDARASAEDIARRLGGTPDEILDRIHQLETSGAILGYQAVVDPEKTGDSDVTAVIEVKITPERGGGFDRLASRIAKFEQVISCYLMSGGYDLLVIVRGRDLREVARFIAEKLSSIEGVLSTATHFRLKNYKVNGLLMEVGADSPRLAVAP